VRPNAINVIPGEAELTIDFRSPDNEILKMAIDERAN